MGGRVLSYAKSRTLIPYEASNETDGWSDWMCGIAFLVACAGEVDVAVEDIILFFSCVILSNLLSTLFGTL
jgi:hypothetical protein